MATGVPRAPIAAVFAACALIALFVAQSLGASLRHSPVFDEPPHIAAGVSYLAGHAIHANAQHPPLLKELSALALTRVAGVRWPATPVATQVLHGDPAAANAEWAIGNEIIATDPDRVLFWARLPLLVVAAGLGVALFWWGWHLFGAVAATGAVLLYALDPTIVAHAGLVTTDVGVTTFTVVCLAALWRYVHRPGWIAVTVCGLALGAALSAKFSAILLVPITAVLLLAAVRRAPAPDAPAGLRGLGNAVFAWVVICAIALVWVEAVYFFPANPSQYLDGFAQVNADHRAGQQAFFAGELAPRFPAYFLAAYLLKEPLTAIALAAVGAVLLVTQPSRTFVTRLFLLLPPAAFVAAASLGAANIGVRYIIPALPFAYLLGGLAFSHLVASPARWARPLAAVLVLWLGVAAAGIYPDHLSYFNEAACVLDDVSRIGWDGGSRCGPRWLDDSNVDWGQGIKALTAWTREHAAGRTVKLAYFGTFPPERYGLTYEAVDPSILVTRPPPGLYAISAFWVGRLPAAVSQVAAGATSWLDDVAPVAVIGHAYYIYDVR